MSAGDPGGKAVDLGEIRRSEEIIDGLAARRAAGPPLPREPALALLWALAADVDRPERAVARPQSWEAAARVVALQIAIRRPARGVGAWLRAAAAGAVVAGVAGTVSIVAVNMLARQARSPGRARARPGP